MINYLKMFPISYPTRLIGSLPVAIFLAHLLHYQVPSGPSIIVLDGLPICGSLMVTFVAMNAKILLPLDLLNLLPSLMWRMAYTSYIFPYYHFLPKLDNRMVIQATKVTLFYMPQILFTITNLLVIKVNFRILRLFIPCFSYLFGILTPIWK